MAEIPHTVLMTGDAVGGVWTYALELTKALQKKDIQVHLATMGKKLSADQQKAADQISNLVIHESLFALEWMENPWQEVNAAGEWLLELEQKLNPDLIHLNGYAHGNLLWEAPVIIVGHSCVLSWWQVVKREQPPSKWETYTRRVRAGLQSADRVIGVTNFMLNQLKKFYGPLKSSRVIYNGRDSNGFNPSAKAPLIFSMGRLWDEAKNIQALETISSDLDWPVYIAGDDRGTLSSEPNANLLGHITDAEVANWLGKTGIYVMPARYEPFGLSVLEAALSGCALVLGDIPSLREVWGNTALYADPNDEDSLKRQIQKLISNTEKRGYMAEKAMKHACRYSPDLFGKQYVQVYQQLLQEKQLSHA